METTTVANIEMTHAGGQEGHGFSTRAIWRTFWVLLAITIFELCLAIAYYELEAKFSNPELIKHIRNGVFAILTLAKAFFIIAEFMHLRHEIKNMIMSVGIPALLFVWFLIAFLWDGNSYKNLRNRYDAHHREQSTIKVEKPAAQHEGEIH